MILKKVVLALVLTLMFVFDIPVGNAAEIPLYYGTNNAKSIYHNMSFKDIKGSFAQKDIMRMTALSVIIGGGDQKFYPYDYVKREEVLAFIIRLMGKEEQVQKLSSSSSSAPVNTNNPALSQAPTGAASQTNSSQSEPKVDSWAKGIIDVALKSNLLDKQDMNLDFTAKATREEVAYWISKGLALSPVYGADIQKVYTFTDSNKFKVAYLPYIEPVLQKGIMSGYDTKKFGPQNNITREQMASVLNRAFNIGYNLMGYDLLNAKVEDITYENFPQNNNIRKTFILLNNSGQNEYIQINQNSDFLMLNGDKPSYSDYISKGDNITFYIRNNNVIFAEKKPSQFTTVIGEIEDISDSTIKVDSYIIQYNANTNVTMNGNPATIKDLRFGQKVLLYIENGIAKSISVEFDDLGSDSIENGSRQITGSVVYIKKDDEGGINIKLDNGNTYKITYGIPVIKDGKNVALSALRLGDNVKLNFDSPYSNIPTNLSIENGFHEIKKVIRGNLGSLINANYSLSILNAEEYYQGQWQKANDYLTYKLDNEKIYNNGIQITREDLKFYKGAQVYITLENHFGDDVITSLNITGNFTFNYIGNIKFNNATGILNLPDGRNIAVNDGTIILKDNLKIPYSSLKDKAQVYVSFSQDTNGLNANFISIIDTKYQDIYYYSKAFLVNATSNSITIGDQYYNGSFYITSYGYYQINDNQWSFMEGSKTYYVGDQTYVVDNTGKEPQIIPYTDLLSVKYGYNNSTKKYLYVVSDKDNALAINIIASSEDERVSTGTISSIDNSIIVLKNVNDWNGLNNMWNLNTSLNSINIKKALIVKDGHPINADSLKPGDNLYIIRSGVQGIIITVK